MRTPVQPGNAQARVVEGDQGKAHTQYAEVKTPSKPQRKKRFPCNRCGQNLVATVYRH